MGLLKACVLVLRAMLIPKVHLAFENLALRQQLAVSKQSVKRPKLRPRDRVFWVWLSPPLAELRMGFLRRTGGAIISPNQETPVIPLRRESQLSGEPVEILPADRVSRRVVVG